MRRPTLERGSWLSTGSLGGRSYSGEKVTVDRALALIPVWACTTTVAGGVGSLPLVVYRRGEVRTRAEEHPYYELLHEQPNPAMAADEFFEILAAHLNLWGNAYIYKWRDPSGAIEALWPFAPERVSVEIKENGERRYWVDGIEYGQADFIHLRGLSANGATGYSPISLARQTIGNMRAQEKFQGKWLSGDGRPSVIIEHPATMSDEAAERLKAKWYSTKTGGAAVIEEGAKVTPWTMPLADAQFLEQQQFSDLRIAQLFLVPPNRLGAKTGDSMTYKTTETEWISFVTYTLRRWLIRIEKGLAADRDLFPTREYFPEFLIDALARADTATRYRAYKLGIDAGFLQVNEPRRWENLPDIDHPPSEPDTGDEL